MKLREFIDKECNSGKHVTSALRSLKGKVIKPPTGEEDQYEPKELEILGVTTGKSGIIVLTNSPLQKNQGLVFKKGFYVNNKDKDSIWNRFEIVGTETLDVVHGIPISVVAAMNGARNATHCYACKKPLQAVFGTMKQCFDCKA